MTKADLVEKVAAAIGPGLTRRECAIVIDGLLNAVKQAMVRGDNIEIRGFGTFKLCERRPRLARNPRTGDPVRVPQRVVPHFKPSKLLRAQVQEAAESARRAEAQPDALDTGQIHEESPWR